MGCPSNYCTLCSASLISDKLTAWLWAGGAGLGRGVVRAGVFRVPPLPDGDAVRERNYYQLLTEFFP